eukprot:CAMPEP_0173115238 /NCGR_PEP_ID=MMETSP1102-20130122/48273_1 /TAXON_ID=49646 /ORGANISM="Geminigera sp., Strain Caron Lab Isolate" /LENGTH=134 /DNA_ID=CAMNT_0014018019 /DNA_START=50 /DNA_END=451 /DNA_ORIENTATION=+
MLQRTTTHRNTHDLLVSSRGMRSMEGVETLEREGVEGLCGQRGLILVSPRGVGGVLSHGTNNILQHTGTQLHGAASRGRIVISPRAVGGMRGASGHEDETQSANTIYHTATHREGAARRSGSVATRSIRAGKKR